MAALRPILGMISRTGRAWVPFEADTISAQPAVPRPARTPESPLAGRGTAGWAEMVSASKGTHARPVRLIIPKIGLNAAIEYVGLTADVLDGGVEADLGDDQS